jgi:hypothetical protein
MLLSPQLLWQNFKWVLNCQKEKPERVERDFSNRF